MVQNGCVPTRVLILGSTGSIGTKALDVIRANPERFEVVGLSAFSRAEEMRAQAEHVGTRMIWDTIVTVDLEHGSPFRAIGDSGDEYIADCVVICTGAGANCTPGCSSMVITVVA